MGADICLNIGPYMVVPRVNGTRKEEWKSCLNPSCKCKKRITAKYCPECGVLSTLQSKDVPCKYTPGNLEEVSEDWIDDLYNPHAGGSEISNKEDYYLPREEDDDDAKKMGIIKIDPRTCGGDDISKIDIPVAIEFFFEKFKKYIDAIIADGGEPEFCYGLLTHYS